MSYHFLFRLPLLNLPYLLGGALRSLELAIVAATAALLLAIALAWVRQLGFRWASVLTSTYVEVLRNTPVLVQLFLVYFGLPSIGMDLSPGLTAVLVLTLNNSAYMAEILRGGIATVKHTQIEAGLSLGMRQFQVFTHVILAPAIRNAAPALANQFIALTLTTSLASQISTEELTYRATLLESRIFHSFEIYAITLTIYFILAQCLMRGLDLSIRRVFRRSPTRNIPQL